MGGLVFAAPWLLLALPLLPALWWLLRVTPPAPRQMVFPAVRLLLGLSSTAQTAARTPWWLLALRLAAAAAVVIGLARPVLSAATALPGAGPLLLVVDDGWAAAPDWTARMRAVGGVLARAERGGRRLALLTTAASAEPSQAGPLQAGPDMPAAELRPLLAVLRPKPWSVDRAGAAAAIRAWSRQHPGGGSAYVGDGITDGDGWDGFARALTATGQVLALAAPAPEAALVLAPTLQPDGIAVRVAQPPRPVAVTRFVLAQSADGRTLTRIAVPIAADAATGEGRLTLPSELRNRLARLVLEGVQGPLPGAGGVMLLDEASRRHPVGILSDDANADALLTGSAFYVRRALAPYAELREGDLKALLARPLSMLVLADHPLPPGADSEALLTWVRRGGLLLRFAGPLLADAAAGDADADPTASGSEAAGDALLPVRLLAADRQLGGAMSWSSPAALAPFPPDTPFAGLATPEEVRVRRQVLTDPAATLDRAIWARLADGTPLVTQRQIGAGRVVLFHVTANADWSNLPLSGLFVDMLRRVVGLSAGVAVDGDAASDAMLAPAETLDGEGVLGSPPPGAAAIAARDFAEAAVSPAHPPGLYGPEAGRRALNLSTHLPLPAASPAIAGARIETLTATAPDRPLGPWLLAAALLLLAADLVLSLRLRGLWRPALAGLIMAFGLIGAARAEAPNPALATRLAFVLTGDATVDDVARAGLAGLSAYVNARTAAVLAEPAAVTPGSDDLSFYPLIYWGLSAEAPDPPASEIAALNDYTAHGGIVVIDTRDGGDGAAPGTSALLRRIGRAGGLLAPPLAPLDRSHVLARSFYLLSEFPGRYAGATVWVGRDQDPSNDSVSPVIVGADDWAAAWAVDGDGRHPYATLPGGERQRTLAYRFGVNIVMYALTGNYKGDQVHVPALLQRFGQ